MAHVPLSELLAHSAQLIHGVMTGQSLANLLPQVDERHRGGVQALSYYALRHWSRGVALSEALLSKKAPNPLVKSLLSLSLILLSAEDFQTKEKQEAAEGSLHIASDRPQYDAFTLVNQAVAATALHKRTASFRGLINACLRRYQREAPALIEQVWVQQSVRYNFPLWWIQKLRQAYPNQYEEIMQANMQPGALCLRVNRRRTTVEAFLEALEQAGIEAHQEDEDALVLSQALVVTEIPGYAEGHFAVQDLAAQQAVKLLPLKPGMRVLDACAAPGGKTCHLLEHYDLHMSILDVDERRLTRVHENLQRLGLDAESHQGNDLYSVRSLAADAADTASWYDGEPFDAIMADVPCTGSGIVRRHPDIKWLRRPDDIAQTVELQRAILRSLWTTLKPGGHLLYITCSIFPEEGEEQALFISEQLPKARRLKAPGQLLPLADTQGVVRHDGFFYALFQKAEE